MGVYGASSSGIAVVGIGAFGTFGVGTDTNGYGLQGENNASATSDGILAQGFGGNLFRGYDNPTASTVFVVDAHGNTSTSGNLSARGSVFAHDGSFGSSSSAVGVFGTGTTFGVEGSNQNGTVAVYANGFGGLLFEGNNSHSNNVFQVDDSGNVFAHSFHATLITSRQPTSAGLAVETYSHQTSQPSLEDFGEAQLSGGVAFVRLEPTFASAIDRNTNYLVFVTPEGDCRGLYVADRSPAGFTIRELQGGRSTLAFSYRIVAKPYASQMARLPLVRMPANYQLTLTQKMASLGPRSVNTQLGRAPKPFAPQPSSIIRP